MFSQLIQEKVKISSERNQDSYCNLPEWIHLDVVRRLTPSKNENQEFTTPDLHTLLEHPTLTTQLDHPT
jgi:hypothetical protein